MVDLRGKVLHRVNMTGNGMVTISSTRARQAGVIYLDITDLHGKKQRFVNKVHCID
jgi:hypothetical protein